ncbi:MAG: hypothetical protein LBH01_02725 [Verrucomicrobiales bacterium]|jgi:hypothetical protein|nr:hypothetical protein [Verrucomicrobiales bacterium]
MEGFGQFIVPLLIIIFAIVKVVSAAKKAGGQPQQPVRHRTPPPVPSSNPPTSRDDWEDLLEALGQKKDADNENPPDHFDDYPTPPPRPAVVPPRIPTVSVPPPPLAPTISTPTPEHKFTRVSDFSSRPLDQIDQREFEVQRNLAEKFTALEGNIASVELRETNAERRPVEHPVHALFRNRDSIRKAIIMSEVLGSPLALRQ